MALSLDSMNRGLYICALHTSIEGRRLPRPCDCDSNAAVQKRLYYLDVSLPVATDKASMEERVFLKPFRGRRCSKEDRHKAGLIRSQQKGLMELIRFGGEDSLFFLRSIGDLLRSGVDALAPDYNLHLNARLGDVCPPVHITAEYGLPQVMELLLQHNGLPNVADRHGVTAAHLAADNGHVECLKVLIAHGADINCRTKSYTGRHPTGSADVESIQMNSLWWKRRVCPGKSTPLHLAAHGNHLRCVTLLLEHGADLNAMNSDRETPLFVAARAEHRHCVMRLLQKTRDCSAVYSQREDTLLIECLRRGDAMRGCIRELLNKGTDAGYQNTVGVSAMHVAIHRRWDMETRWLLVLKGGGMDFDRYERDNPLVQILRQQNQRQQRWRQHGFTPGCFPPMSVDEKTTLLCVQMGCTRRKLSLLLWHELHSPKPPGAVLQALMDSFAYLPPLSTLETEIPPATSGGENEDPAYARRVLLQGDPPPQPQGERLEVMAEAKVQRYEQCRSQVPTLLHLCRAQIRGDMQAEVKKVLSWPLPGCVQSYILLDYSHQDHDQ